jgi:3-oxoacyl-[acyl-carrier protein] reductase
MIDPQIDGKVAIVTGTDNPRGIGSAVARSLARQGVHVALMYFDTEPGALREELRALGVNAFAIPVDLSDPAAIPGMFDRVEEAIGPVDILVNNAAASDTDTFSPARTGAEDGVGRTLIPVTAHSHDLHFAVNSRAVALAMMEFARRSIAVGKAWGRIVNISTGGATGFPGEVSYGASKAALESYSRAAANELAPFGITVNIVSPGPTQTGWIPDDAMQFMATLSPMGRVGTPEDIADSVLFLCSGQAGWLTGQLLQAGGGHKI